MTTTERRLAITPGEAQIGGNYAFHNVLYVPVRVAAPPIGIHVDVSWVLGNGEEARHTASLHADAHNVYNSCHLTPSELLAKLRAITTEIQGAQVSIQRTHDQDPTRYAVVDLDDWHRILAKLNLNLPK